MPGTEPTAAGEAATLIRLPIETKSLLLRHFVPGDAARLLVLSREDAARTWLPSQVYRDDAHALSALEFLIGQYSTPGDPRRGPYVLAIEHRASSTLIGHVGFSPLDNGVEIGFSIAQEHQGQGLASEAIVAASRWALQAFGLDRIVAVTAAANAASRRALARSRFAYEGDKTMRFQGSEHEVSIYALPGGSGHDKTLGMATDSAKRPAPTLTTSAIRWLLDSDPSIRWQAMRDLTGAPAAEIAAERAKVATQGAGARLLSLQAPDGRWGGAAWNRGWDSTMHVLTLLREMGLDPKSPEARRALGLVRDRVTWKGCGPPEADENPFFAGEVEPCINGQVAAAGAYFGQDVRGLVDRLLAEQLPDGGWNCEVENGSTRSSFNTTICVLEALLELEQAAGHSPDVNASRLRGQEYLLERRLFRRRSTGEVIERDRKSGAAWTRFAFPTWWHYDVLRGLDYLRCAGVAPDPRAAEAIALVASKRDDDGRWSLEIQYPGKMSIETDEGEGRPSRWITLRALRVLDWYSARA